LGRKTLSFAYQGKRLLADCSGEPEQLTVWVILQTHCSVQSKY